MTPKSAVKISPFAAQEREAKLDRKGDPLSKLEKYVDFAALAARIDHIAPRPSREHGGRPPFPTELMVRVLVLQELYNLPDGEVEYQLLDRFSYFDRWYTELVEVLSTGSSDFADCGILAASRTRKLFGYFGSESTKQVVQMNCSRP